MVQEDQRRRVLVQQDRDFREEMEEVEVRPPQLAWVAAQAQQDLEGRADQEVRVRQQRIGQGVEVVAAQVCHLRVMWVSLRRR